MGRKKQFSRAGVVEAAIPLFWERGFSGASLQDLEQATGVNRSGLYAEFRGKEDLFVASLEHYLSQRLAGNGLAAQPPGGRNIEHFLLHASAGDGARRGCFSVNALRELAVLPEAAAQVIRRFQGDLRGLLIANVAAQMPDAGADATGAIADMTLAFFLGLCTERQLQFDDDAVAAKIVHFLQVIGMRGRNGEPGDNSAHS